jgi:hypothetical protein
MVTLTSALPSVLRTVGGVSTDPVPASLTLACMASADSQAKAKRPPDSACTTGAPSLNCKRRRGAK